MLTDLRQLKFARWIILYSFSILCAGADLSVSILDDKGVSVAGALVTIHRSSIDGRLRATESYFGTSQNDGTFLQKGLSPGPFVICATVPGRDLVDPCQWNDSQDIVRIPTGAGVVKSTTKLQQGARVSIRVDDPAAAIAALGASRSAPLFVMGVWTKKGRFHMAQQVSSDSGGRDLTMLVPSGVDLAFAINGPGLLVRDDSNNLIGSDQRLTLNLPAGGTRKLHYVAATKP